MIQTSGKVPVVCAQAMGMPIPVIVPGEISLNPYNGEVNVTYQDRPEANT